MKIKTCKKRRTVLGFLFLIGGVFWAIGCGQLPIDGLAGKMGMKGSSGMKSGQYSSDNSSQPKQSVKTDNSSSVSTSK